jgi:hypothetical protein
MLVGDERFDRRKSIACMRVIIIPLDAELVNA